MNKRVVLLVFCIITIFASAQDDTMYYSGVVVDSAHNDGVAFATVSLENIGVSTTTDTNGSFEFKIAREQLSNVDSISLIVTCLGYCPYSIKLDSDASRKIKVYLISYARRIDGLPIKEIKFGFPISIEKKRKRVISQQDSLIIRMSGVYANSCVVIGANDIDFIYKNGSWYARMGKCTLSPLDHSEVCVPDVKIVNLETIMDTAKFTKAVKTLFIDKTEKIVISKNKREPIYSLYPWFYMIYPSGETLMQTYGEECYEIIYNPMYEYIWQTLFHVNKVIIERVIEQYGEVSR